MSGNGSAIQPPRGKRLLEIEHTILHHFDEESCRYKLGHSDESIAKMSETSLPEIIAIRERLVGELKPDPDEEEWRQLHHALIDEIGQSQSIFIKSSEEIEKQSRELEQLCTENTLRLDALLSEVQTRLKEIGELQAAINTEHQRVTEMKNRNHSLRDDVNEKCNKRVNEHHLAIERGMPRRSRR